MSHRFPTPALKFSSHQCVWWNKNKNLYSDSPVLLLVTLCVYVDAMTHFKDTVQAKAAFGFMFPKDDDKDQQYIIQGGVYYIEKN